MVITFFETGEGSEAILSVLQCKALSFQCLPRKRFGVKICIMAIVPKLISLKHPTLKLLKKMRLLSMRFKKYKFI